MVVLVQQSEVYQLSDKSTLAVPDCFFHITEFILGAGIVVVGDGEEQWFLPKGRKDKGGSLDRTALREGHEEARMSTPHYSLPLSDYLIPPCDIISSIASPRPNLQSGYQIGPLPLYSGSLAPDAPTARQGTQVGDQAPPTSTGVGIVGHTRKGTEPNHGLLLRWERGISHVLVCRTDTQRCGESRVFSDGVEVGVQTFNIEY